MSGVNDIRSSFLDFFAREGHEVVPSSPLVPRNDPTLMFTNAGMVQFKNVFTGLEKRPYVRAVTSQKCVRAGGKHNDLDNVGYTARHHTFFEMLGNFSFGDYFKERAIELAWRLVTKEYGMPAEKLMVTVYIDDDEAFNLWKKIAGLPERKIVRIAGADNFWAMGETGPCGPCSEIFYDHGEHIWGGPPGTPEADGDRFVEIWNLVFMQYEQLAADKRVDLPRPSIDTGMGLERIAAVLQGTHDNYKIDLFGALIEAVADLTGVDPDGEQKASHRVIADHLRASAFLIADGVLPSNEGRGYVLRRIMRRGMRHAELLGAKDPLMWRLVPVLVREMGQAYPELHRAEAMITETLKLEETRFRRTLERGLAILDEASKTLKKGDMFDGVTAFTLYDTYGFPLDLTQDALRPRGIGVDIAAFTDAMEEQRKKARASWAGSGEAADEAVWFGIREKVGGTEFLGYETESAEGVVAALVRDGKEVDALKKGDSGAVVLNQTPFYGESGGQVGDTGVMTADGVRFKVTDTQKHLGDVFVHIGIVEEGTLKVGAALALEVDHHRRGTIRKNHSATHLLHEALRQVLGDHVAQKGSLVAPDRLRFDFSHPKPMTRRGDRARRRHRQRHRAAERAGDDAAAQPRRRHRLGRARAVRREIRRRGPRRRHGRGRRQHHGLVGRAVRRHPRQAHRRYRPHLGCRRKRRGRWRAPHRGADGEYGARQFEQSGTPRQGDGIRFARADRGRAKPRRHAARRAQASRTRALGREEEARHGRRRQRWRRRRSHRRRREADGARGGRHRS